MFKNILFATSASPACDDAARVAFDMARRYGARLRVFHVLGAPTRAFSQLVVDMRTGEEVSLDDNYLDLVREELKTTYAKQLAECADCTIDTVVGFTHREILRAAREMDADCIVMGASDDSEGPRTYHKGVTGSTLQRVAKAARCPVLTVARPSASYWGGVSNIVFGTDFSRASDSAFRFALKAARELGAELNIFHALDISSLASSVALSQDEIEEKVIQARDRIRAKYVANLEGFTNYEVEVWEGVPYVEIVKFAREKQADLIVMAHNTRELDPERARIGSTVEQVILRANCPVLSVNRPDKI
ncbi:MAG: universal stress protein [Desulfovibrionaceae bacterium]|jgi:nucleotide-binding universal stress UspA family protein|nr:universal stress protein [Desulfovibrionaceae bacterium]